MSSGEPVATESILKQYGITIIEDVYSPAKTKHILDGEKIVEIPDSVQYVRETLLDIDVTIPNTFKSFFDEELQILRTNNGDTLEIQDVVPPWSAYISLLENPVSTKKIDIEAAEQSVERIAQVARKARRLVAESASQEKWNSFLKTHIFQSFGDSNSVNSKHSELFDSWYLESNIEWKNVSKSFFHYNLPLGTPKPSFTYGFPVHEYGDNQQYNGLLRHGIVANFSFEVLRHLSIFDYLFVCPAFKYTDLIFKKEQALVKSDLVCFPWAVVETQSTGKNNDEAKLCYYEAGYAAYHALRILESLYKKAFSGKETFTVIPPVTAITCAGPEVRVWLVFADKRLFQLQKVMICIWSGNLTSTWCVLCLQQIIKNMTGWATRILKPELSSCISRVISESPSVFVYPLDHLGKVKKEWHEERITKQSDLQKGNKKQRPLFGYPPAERSFDIFMSTIKPAANTASELSKEDGKPRPLFDDSLTQKDSDPLNNTVKSTLNAASDLPKKAGELNPLFGYPPTERQSDTLTSTIKPTVNAASGLPEETGNPHSLFSYPPTEIRSDRSMSTADATPTTTTTTNVTPKATADTTTPLASRNVEPATRGKKRIMHNGRYITINLPSVDNRKCHLGKLNNLDADALGSDNSVHLPREPETAPAARVEIQGESASDNTVTQGGVGSSGSSQGASFYTAREISSPVEDLSQMYCTYETTKSSSRRAHNTWWESYYFGLDENLDKGEDNDEDNGEDNGEDNDEDNDEYNDEDNDEDSDDDDDDDESYVPSTNSDMDMSESEASSESSSTDEEATTSITNTDGERNPSEINNEENANKSTDLASQGVSSSGRIRLLSEIEIKKTLLKAVFALDKSEFASLKTVPEILQGLSRAELYSALWRYSEAEYTEDTPKEIDQTMLVDFLAARFGVYSVGEKKRMLLFYPLIFGPSRSKDEIDQTKAQLQDMSKTSLGENLLIFLCSPDLFFDICSDFLNLDHVLRIGAEALDIIHSKSPLPID